MSLAFALGGAMLAARAAVEHKRTDRRAIVLLAVGALGLMLALATYATGPRRMLPF